MFIKGFAIFIIAFIIFLIVGFSCGMCSDAAKTVYQEYKPSTLLKKYEYFKDLSAAIDKKRADIEMYHSEINSYKIVDKEDKIYIQQRKAELIGIIAMHNQLCSEYNSAMSKFNYRFTNRGDLPESNLEPLPREIKPYILTTN